MNRPFDAHFCFREGDLLPGKSAQVEMAPRYRAAELMEEVPLARAMQAAILILLSPVNTDGTLRDLMNWKVLLIRRNSYTGVHSGQIACPGGKREKSDRDLWHTACREAYEEVGINRRYVEKVGALTELYVPSSNFVIHPFVALNWSEERIRPDPREVVGYKFIPLRIFNPSEAVLVDFEYGNGDIRLAPAWQYGDYTVWGATAMILSELYRLMEREASPPSRDEQETPE